MPGYENFTKIGSGGFSTVYRARQVSMGRDVAVKVLHADVTSELERKTFERECRAVGLLSGHPNIVTVFSEGFTDLGQPAIVMELYSGNYRDRLERTGPLPIPEVLELGVKIASALEAAHEGGVLHRDIKPHNMFVSGYGEPALGDFGISTLDDERSVSAASGLSVAYAAPEVLEDAKATAASDIYSLAASLHHLADGSPPFASKQLRTTVRRILTEPPAPFSREGVPTSLVDTLARAMAKEPADRFRSAADLAEALRSVQRTMGDKPTATPLRRSGDDPVVTEHLTTGAEDAHTVRRGTRTSADAASDSAAPGDAATVSSASASASAPASPEQPAGPGRDQASNDSLVPDDEGTIRRARPAQPSQPEVADHDGEVSSKRRYVAAGLGVAAVIALVVFAVVQNRGGGDAVTTTTQLGPSGTSDIGFLDLVDVPDRIVVEDHDGHVEISFDPVNGAQRYEVTPVAPSKLTGLVFESADPPVVTDLSVDDAPCWQLTVVGESGRFATSPTVCADS